MEYEYPGGYINFMLHSQYPKLPNVPLLSKEGLDWLESNNYTTSLFYFCPLNKEKFIKNDFPSRYFETTQTEDE